MLLYLARAHFRIVSASRVEGSLSPPLPSKQGNSFLCDGFKGLEEVPHLYLHGMKTCTRHTSWWLQHVSLDLVLLILKAIQISNCLLFDSTSPHIKTWRLFCQRTPQGVKEQTVHLNLNGLQSNTHPLLMFNYFISKCVALPLRIGVIIVDRRLPALMDK